MSPDNSLLNGNVNLNMLSCPSLLSAQIFPPCFSTNFLQSNKPKPVPFSLAVPFNEFICVLSNNLDNISGDIPIPLSKTEIVIYELFCSEYILI